MHVSHSSTVGIAESDPTGSFVSQFTLNGASTGPLQGKSLAVKDLFDVSALLCTP
jgi:hypothetical protein